MMIMKKCENLVIRFPEIRTMTHKIGYGILDLGDFIISEGCSFDEELSYIACLVNR